ncbi:MAG: DUF4276 family protein [Candidatus Hydrogenedentes bacterium]|nr:DUF4276 family protein [Candidatus Hydrogenedentota bacterium]
MKFILCIEGNTEDLALPQFIKRWLDPQLRTPVGVKPHKFKGCKHFVKDINQVVHWYLEDRRADEIIAVMGLMDLYGPDFYPSDKRTTEERYTWAKDYVERKVNHSKFRMFFAVHEVEAWLFSQPNIFPPAVARAIQSESHHPEAIDFDRPPKARLKRIYRETTTEDYRPTTQSADLLKKLRPEVAYAKCPYLKVMLDEMLRLVKDAEKRKRAESPTPGAP